MIFFLLLLHFFIGSVFFYRNVLITVFAAVQCKNIDSSHQRTYWELSEAQRSEKRSPKVCAMFCLSFYFMNYAMQMASWRIHRILRVILRGWKRITFVKLNPLVSCFNVERSLQGVHRKKMAFMAFCLAC